MEIDEAIWIVKERDRERESSGFIACLKTWRVLAVRHADFKAAMATLQADTIRRPPGEA